MKDFKRLLGLLGPYKKNLAAAMLLVLIETSLELVIPTLAADLIDNGIATGDVRHILLVGGGMALCALIALITGLTYARHAAKAAYGWGARIREEEWAAVQRWSFSNMDHYETSSLVTRMTSDVTVMQNAINGGLRPLTRAPIMFLLGTFFSFTMNAKLALIFIIMTPMLGLVLFLIVSHVAPMYTRLQATVDNLNSVVEEDVRAIRTVKAFVREEHEEGLFSKVNNSLRNVGTKTNATAALNMPFFQLTMYTATVLIMLLGGFMILDGEMEVGALTGFLSYVLQVMNSMMMLSNVFLLLTRSLASAGRICEVLDEEPSLGERKNPVTSVEDGSVEFRDVSFKYAQGAKEHTLHGISFKAKPGSTIGILGGTGAGKSTLVQLIARLYDVSSGSVLVGGVDVRDYSLEVLRDSVGIVLQKNLLFSGTVRENLLWGDSDAADDELWEACRKAGAEEFLRRFPDGLDTDLGQEGVNVSGGQKQRLCIARSLLKKPRILVFDDSTSAVDSATEAGIRASLARLEDVTKIYIAQRAGTLRGADLILVLDDGRLVDSGTHDELIGRCQVYKEIWASQLKGGSL